MLHLNEGQIMPPVEGAPAVWTYDDRRADNFQGRNNSVPPN
ncbi:hypothetical protein QF050_000627 [Arthrobacter sp. SLBN-112]|nr:hypothetical protein [Arthrobacter sp. SLBN-112]